MTCQTTSRWRQFLINTSYPRCWWTRQTKDCLLVRMRAISLFTTIAAYQFCNSENAIFKIHNRNCRIGSHQVYNDWYCEELSVHCWIWTGLDRNIRHRQARKIEVHKANSMSGWKVKAKVPCLGSKQNVDSCWSRQRNYCVLGFSERQPYVRFTSWCRLNHSYALRRYHSETYHKFQRQKY